MKHRILKKGGEHDYDYLNDILFFKVKNREYEKSIEFSNFVIDIDKEDFIVGVQIFNASDFLRIPKVVLRSVKKWEFNADINKNKIEIRLVFQAVFRNKLIEKNPIILQPMKVSLPDSEMICKVS